MTWEPVIGLEIHVHLKTRTKMFCRCPVGFGGGENTQTCPVCLGFPGALPVVNRRAVEWTIKLGLALDCEIASEAVFARKHYPYPDLPKGYQISQYDLPSCINGKVLLPSADGDRTIGIVRAHLEEDAAKTVHVGGRTGRIGGADYSLIDFNRGGTPLVEIVTAPDLRSADEARRFLQLLRQTIVELGIADAEMEKGQLRADANVSVRPAGSDELRTRTELKNMNSFSFIARGIEAEVERQVGVWESGGEVRQETYDFDAATSTLTPRRAKEEADDYRYFPEPDLVPLEPPGDLVERLRTELPESPAARTRRIESALSRISQEQQSVYQQFQMVQEMRRSEQAQMQPLQSYTPPATPPNYDDVKREEETRAERIQQYQYEIDRLYARYRELEEQKKPLLDELSALAQRRSEEQ